MKFIIDRTTWLRGEGSGDSFLLREDDKKMCCLGSISQQCGITDIVGVQAPAGLGDDQWEKFPAPIRPIKVPYKGRSEEFSSRTWNNNSALVHEMMSVNDDATIKDEKREERLIELCAPHGIELEFIN